MINNSLFNNMLSSPVRYLRGRVEIFKGSTLALICGCHDRLKSFTVERIGDKNKFFGFGICQKLNAHILDVNRELEITTENTLEIEFGVGSDYIYPLPNFYVTEVNRDENTNELSITAYDALYRADKHTVAELGISANYTIAVFAAACAALLDIPLNNAHLTDDNFLTLYPTGANFDGTETIRQALDAIAEATQTIYYINKDWELTFKKLDISGEPVITIDKSKYIELDSKTNRRLTTITHATELGDTVSATTGVSGSTQYIRNNPFWELRDDIGELVDKALANAGGLTINQFTCNWRGNYLVEIGDKLALTTKDNETVISFLINDTISFNGALSQKTSWNYENSESETASNPTNLGEALKQTYARVDKANKQIELVASESAASKDAISALQINTESISASVTKVEQTTSAALENATTEIATLKNQVAAQITAEDVRLEIEAELANGTTKVTTTTGFTFNEDGLTVEKSDSEMKTQITEDGMKIYKNSEQVLTADNVGVNAVNLKATNYLIIDNNSRFEDYGTNRTACFWVGGAN